jgi:hypothetical protein
MLIPLNLFQKLSVNEKWTRFFGADFNPLKLTFLRFFGDNHGQH